MEQEQNKRSLEELCEDELSRQHPSQKILNICKNAVKFPVELEKRRHGEHHRKHLILDALLMGIIAVLIGVVLNNYFFSKKQLLNLLSFEVTTNTQQLINGKDVIFTVAYANTSPQSLSDVHLVLRVPNGLRNTTFDNAAFNTLNNTLEIGTLEPGAHGSFAVSGRLLGNIGLKEKFLAVITYTNDLGQPRQEFFTKGFDLSDSVLDTAIAVPDKVFANSPFDTLITVANTSDSAFEDARLELRWPEGYSLTTSSFTDATSDTEFPLGVFEQGSQRSFTFTGRTFSSSPRPITISALVYITERDQEFLLAKRDVTVPLEFSKFIVQFNDIEQNAFIQPGGTTTYKILYKNNEDFVATDVRVSATFAGDYVDVATLGGSRTVTFTAREIPKLASVAPGEEGIIEVTVRALGSVKYSELREEGNEVRATATAIFTDSKTGKEIGVGSRELSTSVGTSVSLQNFALFYTSFGDQIGVGPIPPLAGEYTSYWAVIKILNTGNEIRNVRVTATIPAGVEITHQDNVTAGNQIQMLDAKTIEWFMPSVPAYAGIFTKAPEAHIELGIIPSASQVGTIPVLLENIQVRAVDTKTQQEVSAIGPAITTAIFKDRKLNIVAQ